MVRKAVGNGSACCDGVSAHGDGWFVMICAVCLRARARFLSLSLRIHNLESCSLSTKWYDGDPFIVRYRGNPGLEV